MASNSDVQYVAYLKAKFNLEDSDLLQVIALSQRSDSRPIAAAADEEEEEVIEEEVVAASPSGYEEEVKEEVVGMDTSGYEEVIEEDFEEEVEYMDESFAEQPIETEEPDDSEVKALELPGATPSPSPEGVALLEGAPPETSNALVPAETEAAPEGQEVVLAPAPSPSGAIVTPTGEIVEYEEAEAPDDEVDYDPSVMMPETVVPDPVTKGDYKKQEEANLIIPDPVGEQPGAIEPGKDEELAIEDEEKLLAIEEEEVDPNALAIVPAKTQNLVQKDEEEGKLTVAEPPLKEQDQDEKEDQSMLMAVALVCILLLIGIAVVLVLIFGTGTIPKFWEGDPGPVEMSPYQTGCNFEGQAQPNVVSQCNCEGQVNTVADYTRGRYETLSTTFIPTVYSSWGYTIESCEPANQALLWLSTGPVIEDPIVLTQRFSLAFFYYATSGQGWFSQSNWMSTNAECTWFGVTCSGANLQQIQLLGNSIDGVIPSEIGLLTQLNTLSLDQNNIRATIPFELFNLGSLQTLTLGSNQLSGFIPSTIGLAVNLQNLRLNSNLFRGTVPSELNSLTRLQSLSLESNTMLTGRIATEYGRFTNLQSLSLSNTRIRAYIPSEYGNLVNLQEIKIANTNVGGRIPTQFGQLSRLRIVDFSGSRFRKNLPTTLGGLTDLSTLLLGSNELEGAIPSELGNLFRLGSLELHDNEFSGLLPSELGGLGSLSTLTIQGNPQLQGHPPEQLCLLSQQASLANFTSDCPTRSLGIVCPIPTCCSECVGIIGVETEVPETFP